MCEWSWNAQGKCSGDRAHSRLSLCCLENIAVVETEKIRGKCFTYHLGIYLGIWRLEIYLQERHKTRIESGIDNSFVSGWFSEFTRIHRSLAHMCSFNVRSCVCLLNTRRECAPFDDYIVYGVLCAHQRLDLPVWVCACECCCGVALTCVRTVHVFFVFNRTQYGNILRPTIIIYLCVCVGSPVLRAPFIAYSGKTV